MCNKLKKIHKVSTRYSVCYDCINAIPPYLEDEQRLKWLVLKIADNEKNKNT